MAARPRSARSGVSFASSRSDDSRGGPRGGRSVSLTPVSPTSSAWRGSAAPAGPVADLLQRRKLFFSDISSEIYDAQGSPALLSIVEEVIDALGARQQFDLSHRSGFPRFFRGEDPLFPGWLVAEAQTVMRGRTYNGKRFSYSDKAEELARQALRTYRLFWYAFRQEVMEDRRVARNGLFEDELPLREPAQRLRKSALAFGNDVVAFEERLLPEMERHCRVTLEPYKQVAMSARAYGEVREKLSHLTETQTEQMMRTFWSTARGVLCSLSALANACLLPVGAAPRVYDVEVLTTAHEKRIIAAAEAQEDAPGHAPLTSPLLAETAERDALDLLQQLCVRVVHHYESIPPGDLVADRALMAALRDFDRRFLQAQRQLEMHSLV